MNVVMASSSPRIPNLLTRSVAAHATEKIPSDAGPIKRATSKVTMPRKFDVTIAAALSQAPRFNSVPVASDNTGRAAPFDAEGAILLSRFMVEAPAQPDRCWKSGSLQRRVDR